MASNPTILCGNSVIRGSEKTSIRGKTYYCFLGIPYAEPPIKQQRFLAPQPVKLPDVVDATKPKNCAVQMIPEILQITGNEDCLYLNVFIPELPSEKRRPVIFCIHGGSHLTFSANFKISPELIIKHDVIIVTINYRLSVFGFLNLRIPECPGNAGCKDLVCGLLWVRRYIQYFGGNPDNITVMGISSGASMAHLMALSPLCKNMFKKIICSGGHARSPWNFVNSPIAIAFEYGKILGFEGQDENKLCNFLKSCSTETLITAVGKLNARYSMNLSRNRFLPSVELIEETAFLPENPLKILEKMDPISMIFGITEFEGCLVRKRRDFPKNWSAREIMRGFLDVNISVKKEYFEDMLEEILQFYKSGDKSCETSVLQFLTDMILIDYYNSIAILQNKLLFFYAYKFTYCGNGNSARNVWGTTVEGKEINGSYHADDFGYLLSPNKDLFREKDWEVADTFCSYLTNFAKDGNPNGSNVDCVWTPSSSKNEGYLQIGDETKMISYGLNSERAKFWIYLKKKYSFE